MWFSLILPGCSDIYSDHVHPQDSPPIQDKTYVNFLLVESVLTDKMAHNGGMCSLGHLSPQTTRAVADLGS